MPSKKDKLQFEARFRILHLLENDPQMSQRELSQELGISLGAVNFCVKALVEKGHLKIRNFRASNKKTRYAYVLTPSGVAEKAKLTGRYFQRKLEEYDALKAEIMNLQKGMEAGTDQKPKSRAASRAVPGK